MDTGAGISSPIVLNIPVNDDNADCLTSKMPRRLQRRLREPKTHTISAQDIEAKLRDAYLRRQQFYELLLNKARSKSRSRISSPSEKYLHLEAKHKAAEQKRLMILAQIRNRLARMDQLRQDAKNGLQMRFMRERNELSTKVESRLQQAETKRMILLNAIRQRQVARRDKAYQSLARKQNQQKKYKECIRAAMVQKRTAAQRKRLGFLEAQQRKARTSALQVQQAAGSRAIDGKKAREQLQNPLQRAKRHNLRKKGSLHNSSQATEVVNQMKLYKVLRCWKMFVRLKGTTFALAKTFANLEINQKSVKSMPFERLAELLGSSDTTSKVKALLHRIESRVIIRQEIDVIKNAFHMENIDHLLIRVAGNPGKSNVVKSSSSSTTRIKTRSGNRVPQRSTKLCRYPARVILGTYIISGHPDVVSRGVGKHETSLVRAADEFLQAFELLIKLMLQMPIHSSEESCVATVGKQSFSSQLEIFDKAWCSYLHQFVDWKVKDSKLLEKDLVKAVSQLEGTRDTYKKLEGDFVAHKHSKSSLDQKVHNVSGNDSCANMEKEFSDTPAELTNKVDIGVSSLSTPHLISSAASSSASLTNSTLGEDGNKEGDHVLSHVLRSRLNMESMATCSKIGADVAYTTTNEHQSSEQEVATQNAAIVNELVHSHYSGLADSLVVTNEDKGSLKSRMRETMEKAFWDGVMETLKQDTPDYSWVLKLIQEVHDELCGLSPSSWKQEIDETIDLGNLSQVLQKENFDIEYCGNILEYSLVTLQKLSAPAKEDELKIAHLKLLTELSEISEVGEKPNASFALIVMRGLRFVLKEIQALKNEISKARVSMLEPLIKGSTGFEYLKSSFTKNYGSPSDAPSRLPIVCQWLSSVLRESEQNWVEYQDSLLGIKSREADDSKYHSPTILRTGGSAVRLPASSASLSVTGAEQPSCKGEKIDLLVRLGLLKLAVQVDGVTTESLPETLQLNLFRLRSIQSQLQKIIVICTSILVLRQTLAGEHLVTSAQELESVMTDSVNRISELLDNDDDAGIHEIVETMNGCLNNDEDQEKIQSRKDIMSNMLGKSLSAGNAIFSRVSGTVCLAARGIVLGGSGRQGKQLAETSLKRIGAAHLTEKLVKAVQELVVMANVSQSIHLAWYEQVLRSIYTSHHLYNA